MDSLWLKKISESEDLANSLEIDNQDSIPFVLLTSSMMKISSLKLNMMLLNWFEMINIALNPKIKSSLKPSIKNSLLKIDGTSPINFLVFVRKFAKFLVFDTYSLIYF